MRRAFVHGFAGSPAIWSGIARPDDDDICIALPGHGATPVQPTWDANLAAVAQAIGPACDLVVGYSLGARIALGLLATGRAARAILISVNPGIRDAERAARRANDAAWAHMLRERGLAAFFEAWQAQPLFATQSRAPADRRAARGAARRALDPEQLARTFEVMGLAEMPDHTAAVTADRCRLIVGADDTKFLAIARTLPAPLDVIADCGHDPTLEQPATLADLLVSNSALLARRGG